MAAATQREQEWVQNHVIVICKISPFFEQAMNIARFLANVVGKAHARQMDEDTRSKWAKELSRARTGDLKAPSWLWSSVVDLLVIHEKAYLEHCRLYALNESRY